MIAAMQDDRDIAAAVGNRLIDRRIEFESLAPLDLDVHPRNVMHHVGRIGTAGKLHTSPGGNAKHAADLGCRLAFAGFSLIARFLSHTS